MLLYPGHRVAWDRSSWEMDGPAYVLGSVTDVVTDANGEPEHVRVEWDDGKVTPEFCEENEFVFLATATNWYFTRKIAKA